MSSLFLDINEHRVVPPSTLRWNERGEPVSSLFNDIYFSAENGLQESRYIFIQHNNLCSRLLDLAPGKIFTIAETGFGTGLNFLALWQLFEHCASANTRLHFISIEKFPLSAGELAKVSRLWPELAPWSQSLLQHYPEIQTPGFHRLVLAGGRVMLTLIFSDLSDALEQLDGKIDVWFLDGFAPAKNPAMWSTRLFETMKAHAHSDTTYATFTASGVVRRALQRAGFSAQRKTGFKHKRHLMCGGYTGIMGPEPESKAQFIWSAGGRFRPEERRAIVIGAGLAGCATARSLALKGWKVTVIDGADNIADGASGNLQGSLYMRLSGEKTALSQLLLQGYAYTLCLLNTLMKEGRGRDWSTGGLAQIAFNEAECVRQKKIIAQGLPENFVLSGCAETLAQQSGIAVNYSGLWFERGGWVHPPALCRAMLSLPDITFRGGCFVSEMEYIHGNWHLYNKKDPVGSAPVVVLANGFSTAAFAQTAHLPLSSIRGQLTYIPATEKSQRLNAVLCGRSYVLPAINGLHTIGATSQFNERDLSVRISDHEENLLNLKREFPSFYLAADVGMLSAEVLEGRTGFRCTTPDYLPVIGPVADKHVFNRQFAMLAKNSKHQFGCTPEYYPGLYVNTGHGTRGLITCPLGGEILASYINNEAMPVPLNIMRALHPNRFLARALISQS